MLNRPVKVAFFLFSISFVNSVPVAKDDNPSSIAKKDLTLYMKEKEVLDKFKEIVKPLNHPERFKKDTYLIRWLRASSFNLTQAEKKYKDNMKWRKKYKIDSIYTEDWSEFEMYYPFSNLTTDKNHQPVTHATMGTWDYRRVVLEGLQEDMVRYVTKMYEDMDVRIYEQQKKGYTVTRGQLIIDAKEYNLVEQGCVQCLPIFLEYVRNLDRHYPLLYEKVVVYNVPGVFDALLNLVKNAMSQNLRDMLQVFGTNKDQWKPYLLTFIDEKDLPEDV